MNRRQALRYSAYAALSAPFASAILAGCKAEPEMLEAGFEPVFFSNDEYSYVTRLADTMLPKTDTPGAVEVGVPQMIDKTIGEVYDPEGQEKFRAGLKALMGKMDADNPGGFAKLEQDAALIYLQDQDLFYKENPTTTTMSGEDVPTENYTAEAEGNARSAYFGLKSMIIGNYFNTPEVAMESGLLVYQPVPGEYIPCGDLEELTGGRAWAI